MSLAVPSTSPHGSPTGMMKDSATPPPSPSLSGLAALGFVYNIVQNLHRSAVSYIGLAYSCYLFKYACPVKKSGQTDSVI